MMIAALLPRVVDVDLARSIGYGRRRAGAAASFRSTPTDSSRELVRTIVIFPLEMIFIGGIVAGFVWGAYLTVCCLFGLHCDQAFASMGIPNFKNFLRLKIEPNKLTIYPIGLTPRAEALGLALRQGAAAPRPRRKARRSCRCGRCVRRSSRGRSRYGSAT